MHHLMDTILKRLRQDLASRLDPESILAVCRSVGHSWRNSPLNPVATLHWFLTQILHGNTSLEHISLLANRLFTDSAYCQARARLPLNFFRGVLANQVRSLVGDTPDQGLWRGHRTLLIDGSAFSMPDTPELQQHFGQPSNQAPGCGFPVAKVLAVFHAATGMLLEVVAAPLRTHEMSQLDRIYPHLKSGDVLVGDRGFCSFAHLMMLFQGGIHAVFRMHQRQLMDFTPARPHASQGKGVAKGLPRSRWLRRLGELDQVVEWFKPEGRPAWMTAEQFAAMPGALVVRELRYRVGRRGFRTHEITLATTLVDVASYPLEALADLYGSRWRVELDFRHLKTTMEMDVLKCETAQGVLKELAVYAMAYNLVRVVMDEAARRQGVHVERISFVDALRWLARAHAEADELPALVVNPDRHGRFEPRVRKRRPKQYPLMKKPRSVLRNALSGSGFSA